MNKIQSKELQIYVAQNRGAEKFLYFGSKETLAIRIILSFNNKGYSADIISTQDEKLIFRSEVAGIGSVEDGGIKTLFLANPSSEESGLPSDNFDIDDPCQYVSKAIENFKAFHFHDTSDTAKVKKACRLYDYNKLKPDGENLAAFLYYLQEKENESYQKIVQTIQRVAPFFHNFILQPDRLNTDLIRLKWKHTNSDDYFDANDLSDGTLRFICLATLLLQPNLPSVILLDEPELGLHPYAIQLLAGMMKSAATKTQVIASTQSVTLANQFECKDIIVAEQKDGASTFKRLKEEDYKIWLDDYQIGDLWEKNLIGGNPL